MRDIIVIADTSCLIALTKIESIGLLKELYQEIYITEEMNTGRVFLSGLKLKKLKTKDTNKSFT